MKKLLILLLCVGCAKGITREEVKSIKHGTKVSEVLRQLGQPDEWAYKNGNKDKVAFLYRNGNLHCALEFSLENLYSTSCLETK